MVFQGSLSATKRKSHSVTDLAAEADGRHHHRHHKSREQDSSFIRKSVKPEQENDERASSRRSHNTLPSIKPEEEQKKEEPKKEEKQEDSKKSHKTDEQRKDKHEAKRDRHADDSKKERHKDSSKPIKSEVTEDKKEIVLQPPSQTEQKDKTEQLASDAVHQETAAKATSGQEGNIPAVSVQDYYVIYSVRRALPNQRHQSKRRPKKHQLGLTQVLWEEAKAFLFS